MKFNKRIPVTLGFLACFILVAAAANISRNAIMAGKAGSDGRKVIVIDAGHGGLDSGCVGVNGVLEKDINLSIAQNLEQLLTLSGFDVVLTRDEDISIYDNGVEGIRNQKISDMENRLDIVKSYPDSMFFSIHQNQYTQPEYFGAQMFYTTNNAGNFKLAQIMQRNFAALQEGNDREIKLMDSGLYLFKETTQPALLIECGFLSNEKDAANLSDSEYQKKVAFTIYKGIMEFLSTVKPQESTTTEEVTANGEIQNGIYLQ